MPNIRLSKFAIFNKFPLRDDSCERNGLDNAKRACAWYSDCVEELVSKDVA
jgi:hypothetical protein